MKFYIDQAPTIEPCKSTEQKSADVPSGETISRADAIDAIQNAYCKPCKERGDDHNEVRCRVCEYDNAIIQIDALPSTHRPKGEWTPITTSEPNTTDHVLVTYNWGDDDLEVGELDYWVTKKEAEDGNASCKRLIDHVIAWRPMVKPYRKENEE